MRGRRALAATGMGLALVLAGCGHDDTKAESKPATRQEAPLELARADVAQVRAGVLGAGLPVTGSLQAFNQTTVQSRVASDVAAVFVREGEVVKKGQLLARLGTQEVDARLKQAEANLSSAKVDAQLARALFERNKQIFEKHYISELDFQRSQGDAEAREEAVRAQQALVDIARKNLNDANVIAPMSGVVAKRYIEPGSSVGMDSKLFDIVDLSDMELAAPVPATDIGRVKVGQSVSFTVDGFGEQAFTGKVARINPVADAGTRAVTVYVRVANSQSSLKGGMFAHGVIASEAGAQALIIPTVAVHKDPGQEPYVLVLDNGRLQQRNVTLGASDDNNGQVSVQAGLAAGETVVVAKLGADAAKRAARISGV